jgi:hypothetical protein
MVDSTTLAEAAARDPLLGAFVLMATGALVSRLLFKQQPIWRAIVRVVFLILLTLLLLHNGIVPYEPLHSTGTPFHDVIVGTLKIAWWFWAAWFLVALIRSVVVFEHRRHEGKLIQDLLSALIYLAATFAIVAYVFDLPVQGLLVTSGGVLSVTKRDKSGETELLRFGPGDVFGEIGLLTGASCGASVIALAPSTVYELAKRDLAPFWRQDHRSPRSLVVRLLSSKMLVVRSPSLSAMRPRRREGYAPGSPNGFMTF